MAMTPRQLWLTEGRAVVPEDVVEPGLWEEIAEEADRCEPHAVVRHNQRPGPLVMRDGSITSPSGAGSTPAETRSAGWPCPSAWQRLRAKRPAAPA